MHIFTPLTSGRVLSIGVFTSEEDQVLVRLSEHIVVLARGIDTHIGVRAEDPGLGGPPIHVTRVNH